MRANLNHRLLLLAALPLLVAILPSGGCGKQDLYEPPGSPYQIVGRLRLPSITEGIAVSGRYAFLAGGQAGLHTVDWSDPAAPRLLATINTTKYADDIQVVRTFTGGVLRDIAHIVEGTEGVTSYDVTDPNAPSDYLTGTTAVVGRTIFIAQPDDPGEPYVVYLAEDWKGVRIFESVPDDPGILAYNGVFVGTNGAAFSIEVKDGWGYCADSEMGLCVLDLRILDLNAVALVSWADTPGDARAVALEGDYAFVADGVEGLAVFRIDAGETPVAVAHYDLSGFCQNIVVRDGLCAISANAGGVHFMDVRDPANPIYLGTTATSYASDVTFSPDGHCLVTDEDDGLYILGGRGPFDDTTPPTPVTDLVAEAAAATRVDLNWTMTGNDRMLGTADGLEFRRAEEPITDAAAWDAATPVAGAPAPEAPGTPMTFSVTGLSGGTTYHFAARVHDAAGNVSALSNDASVTTPQSIFLRNPRLDVDGGVVDQTFTYEIEAVWEEGEFTATEVIIDGTPRTMSLVADDLYRYQTTLAKGSHTYSFRFAGAGQPDGVTDEFTGPLVGEVAFTMGSPNGENGRDPDESLHLVVLLDPVIAGSREVTQDEWEAVMDPVAYPNPSQHPGADRPVDSVPWIDAVRYCNARSLADGLTPAYTIDLAENVTWNRDADGWRLPTEAEWEYVCRAGTTTALYSGDLVELNCRLDANLDAIGWYCGNTMGPEIGGQKTANAFGLYDTSGNLREWCWDWYATLDDQAVLDPAGPESGVRRVCRGGNWYLSAQACRSAARAALPLDSTDDTVGFRVVRTDFTD